MGTAELTYSDRLSVFINSLDKGNTEFLNRLEKQAKTDGIPIIRRETQSMIKFLLGVKQPRSVLEIGTAVGFSAILMCTYGPDGMNLTTIEDYDERIPAALENIKNAGMTDRIHILNGDANDILPGLKEKYDMIFVDAAKAQYINYLPDVIRLLDEGGIMVADNCLQDGDILESKFAVERRNRTIHKRMREFLYSIKNDDRLVTSIIPSGDGMALSVKRTR